MTYKDTIQKILNIDKKIRFVTISDIHGKHSELGHQEGVQNLLDFHESRQLLQLAIKSWNARNLYENKIGLGEYAIATYEKLKRISVKFGPSNIVYLTAERDIDHDKVILEILKM